MGRGQTGWDGCTEGHGKAAGLKQQGLGAIVGALPYCLKPAVKNHMIA